ncbi:Type IV pilus biogenesis protein PilE [Aequoribacter fuscus]|uniref:Type IV pilus biogenesis protein PilE n=1 Tax=Aequoribacter fuscus TaxID=2518989 RepID=F3L5E6_9GAMM|nr:Type IV pilus biogenesis protein PilE [Aequoribacter fuscus]
MVELIIVVAIVAILAAVALPSYQSQVAETKRSEAQVALQSLAIALETYYRKNLTYVGPVFYENTKRSGLAPTELYPEYLPKDYSAADYATKATYRLSFSTQTANTYTIVATAQGSQASADSGCATMTLNHLGVVTPAGCWK